MRAVLLDVSQAILDQRAATGADRWDEYWNGELHMVPPPSIFHQRLQDDLLIFLKQHCKALALGEIISGVGIKNPDCAEKDFRVPDLSFISTERSAIVGDQWIEGGPDLVVEIHSPGDESYEKLPFYATLGVKEVVIIDRDTCKVELFHLAGKSYLTASSNQEGWFFVQNLRIEISQSSLGLLLRSVANPEKIIQIGLTKRKKSARNVKKGKRKTKV